MLDVCLLGTGGMIPLPERWLTAFLVRYNGRMVLIDCGEGTQIPLRKAEWGFKSIDAILFTHYHADHTAGLPGLLLTLGNSGREEPLTLVGPPGLKNVVEGLTVVSPQLPYELRLIELKEDQCSEILISGLSIKSMPVDHSIPCLSYCIELKRQGKFEVERARNLNIPVTFWGSLQKGDSITFEGRTISPDMVMGKERKGIKVCYCTDTRPTEALEDFVKNADLFVCEGMYGGEEESSKAVQKKHMTFIEAATLASKGEVKELWLTHYSPSLTDPEEFIENTRMVFKNTLAGKDLISKTLKYSD
ncbi:ribonuclease Z [Acetivibrio cellulolyticus]|uniref:ribonuclease Z n=1 Tax=Acetivibrio cellulolyticus TaxID=35830 RepID=UPI0003064E98|nr:ribonuclease Z [Acetivibrio cellulolyticus]